MMNKVLNEQEREMFCGASAETLQREEAELKLWKRVKDGSQKLGREDIDSSFLAVGEAAKAAGWRRRTRSGTARSRGTDRDRSLF
jgi:hypothetical protein